MEETPTVNPLAIKILLDDFDKRDYDLEYKLALQVIQTNDFTDETIFTDALAIIKKHTDEKSPIVNTALELLKIRQPKSKTTTSECVKTTESDLTINPVPYLCFKYGRHISIEQFYHKGKLLSDSFIENIMMSHDDILKSGSFEVQTLYYLCCAYVGKCGNEPYIVNDFLNSINIDHEGFQTMVTKSKLSAQRYYRIRKFSTLYVNLFIEMKKYGNDTYTRDESIHEFIDKSCYKLLKLYNNGIYIDYRTETSFCKHEFRFPISNEIQMLLIRLLLTIFC